MLRSILLSTFCLFPIGLWTDEGRCPFDGLPPQKMKPNRGFAPDQAWLDHLRLATVLFGEQSTGSFVGCDGIVLPHHHVAQAILEALTKVHDPTHFVKELTEK